MQNIKVDILVIGGGVIGCSVLRELTEYAASVALVEARPDVCDCTSKANSGIVHTGFDAPPDTLEARLLAESRELWPKLAAALGFTFSNTGAVLVATNRPEMSTIGEEVLPKARRNRVPVRRLAREEVRLLAPYTTDSALGGALIEGESVCDPFMHSICLAQTAVLRGAQLYLNERVVNIDVHSADLAVRTESGSEFRAKAIINCGGLWSDAIAHMVGDTSFSITPRKGQFIVTHDDLGVDRIVLPVPNKITKGILLTPAVFGGTVMGPTAEDVSDKFDTTTTAYGMQRVRDGAAHLVPAARHATSVRQYAGVRPVSSTGEYIIEWSKSTSRLLHVAGIRSTGLSASPGIARHVANMVRKRLALSRSTTSCVEPASSKPVAQDESVLCLCKGIRRSQVLAVLRQSSAPTNLDALKRRTGVMLGECQGNICIPELLDLMSAHCDCDASALDQDVPGSNVVFAALQKT